VKLKLAMVLGEDVKLDQERMKAVMERVM